MVGEMPEEKVRPRPHREATVEDRMQLAYKGWPSGTPLWLLFVLIALTLAIAYVVRRRNGG